LLRGQASRITDDLGNVVSDVNHRGRFVFRRGGDGEADDFADARIGEKLALASRATASFPVAFEPLFCPVNAATPPHDARLVDMRGIATFPSSRYVLDGGILDNKPLESAIEAIFAQHTDRDVRRVLCYVVPDPGETAADIPDSDRLEPSLGRVALASLVSLPRVESISEQLRAIVDHNRQVRRKRETRMTLLRSLGAGGMLAVAGEIFPYCRERRRQSSAEYVVDAVAAGVAESTAGGVALGRRRRAWLTGKLTEAVDFPWVPPELPALDGAPASASGPWPWGAYTVENLAETMQDFLGRTSRLMPPDVEEARSLLRHGLRELRRAAALIVADTLAVRAWDKAFWRERGIELGALLYGAGRTARHENVEAWAAEAVVRWKEHRPALRHGAALARLAARDAAPAAEPLRGALAFLADAIAGVLSGAVPIARAVAEAARSSSRFEERSAAADLEAFCEYLAGPPSAGLPGEAPAPGAVLSRLLLLEVVLCSVDCHRHVRDQFVELVQVSGETRSPFEGPSGTDSRLAGLQLAHFGAFYKKSWRANDWMFGRLDGADRLVRLLLNPSRLARLYFGPGAAARLADVIGDIAVPAGLDPSDRDLLEPLWLADRPAVESELAFLEDGSQPVPEQLVAASVPIVRRIHLGILRAELEKVADAVDADVNEGADSRSAAVHFRDTLRRQSSTFAGWDRVTAKTVVDLFRQCRVGAEQLTREVGSDLFTKTVSQAAAVATSALAADSAGIGAARSLFTTLRLPVLLFDGLTQTVVRQSRTATALLAALFAGSGAIVALDLLSSANVPPLVLRPSALVLVAVGALLLRKRLRLVAAWLVLSGLVWVFHRWLSPLIGRIAAALAK